MEIENNIKRKMNNKSVKLALIGNIKIPYATKTGLSNYFKSEGHTFSSGVRIILNDYYKKISKN